MTASLTRNTRLRTSSTAGQISSFPAIVAKLRSVVFRGWLETSLLPTSTAVAGGISAGSGSAAGATGTLAADSVFGASGCRSDPGTNSR